MRILHKLAQKTSQSLPQPKEFCGLSCGYLVGTGGAFGVILGRQP
jgi:hypothetical protein